MFKISLKKRIHKSLFGPLVALSLLPVAANAATVDSVLIKGSMGYADKGQNGATDLVVNFGDTTGAWFGMNASPSVINEHFSIQIWNSTNAVIDGLYVEVYKPDGGWDLGTSPTSSDWIASSSQVAGLRDNTSLIVDESNRHRIHIDFGNPLADGKNMTLDLNTLGNIGWTGFNNDGQDFLLNLDANGVDNNLPDIGAVPLPAAFWLFGSGLVGLLAAKRRQQS